jgi:hypothetical protein
METSIKICDKEDCFVIHNKFNNEKYCAKCKWNIENYSQQRELLDNYLTNLQKYGY